MCASLKYSSPIQTYLFNSFPLSRANVFKAFCQSLSSGRYVQQNWSGQRWLWSKGRSAICQKKNDAQFRICNTSSAWAPDFPSHWVLVWLTMKRWKWIRRHHELCHSSFRFALHCLVEGTDSWILPVRLIPGPWCECVSKGIAYCRGG